MLRMSKVRINGLDYLAVTQHTLADFKNIHIKQQLLKKHDAKTLGIKIFIKEVIDKIEYKYIYKDMGNYLYIYAGELKKLIELFGDIGIEYNSIERYGGVESGLTCTRCEKCNGIIFDGYRYDGNVQDLCCHGYSFEQVYKMTHAYPKVYKYENDTLSEATKEELKTFNDSMTKDNINTYRAAYSQLGKVVFRVNFKSDEEERIKDILSSIGCSEDIVVSDKIIDDKVIDMILKYGITSIIEQLMLNKLMCIDGLEIIPQYTIDMFKVDFFIKYKDVSLVIECDGECYHNMHSDYPRQRYIQIKGYDIMRFTGKEIVNDINMCSRQIIDYLVTIHNRKQ